MEIKSIFEKPLIEQWIKSFVTAILTENRQQLESAIQENSTWSTMLFLLPVDTHDEILFNDSGYDSSAVQRHKEAGRLELERAAVAINKKLSDNIRRVVDIIWRNGYHTHCLAYEDDNAPKKNQGNFTMPMDADDVLYKSNDFNELCSIPVSLYLCSPFLLSGEYVFYLVQTELRQQKGLEPSIKFPPPIDDSIIPEDQKKIFFRYGKDRRYDHAHKLQGILHMDLSRYPKKRGGELWKLMEICRYVDLHSEKDDRKHGIRPLFHILEQVDYFWHCMNEIHTGLSLYSRKFLLFRTIIFQQLPIDEKIHITSMIHLLRYITNKMDTSLPLFIFASCKQAEIDNQLGNCIPYMQRMKKHYHHRLMIVILLKKSKVYLQKFFGSCCCMRKSFPTKPLTLLIKS